MKSMNSCKMKSVLFVIGQQVRKITWNSSSNWFLFVYLFPESFHRCCDWVSHWIKVWKMLVCIIFQILLYACKRFLFSLQIICISFTSLRFICIHLILLFKKSNILLCLKFVKGNTHIVPTLSFHDS